MRVQGGLGQQASGAHRGMQIMARHAMEWQRMSGKKTQGRMEQTAHGIERDEHGQEQRTEGPGSQVSLGKLARAMDSGAQQQCNTNATLPGSSVGWEDWKRGHEVIRIE